MLATDLGLTLHPRARAYVFPSLGAYVGGDIVAGMLASGMDRDKRLRLFIDVGTNCEIVLGDSADCSRRRRRPGRRSRAASIRCGMRAADGAIEVVELAPDGVALQVIGDVEPVGLCGSGLVDAVAELVAVGLLDASGRLLGVEKAREQVPGLADRLVELDGGERVFVLHWRGEAGDVEHAIYLSQRDVRELQFAKAAIATGWQLLIEEAGAQVADIQQVLLAGSFGSYLSPASAVRIGLVPKVPVLRIVSAGNVAGEGAKMALLSIREREGARTAAGGGALCRALRPHRLQRPLRRPARLPRLSPSGGPAFGPDSTTSERWAVVACGALSLSVQRVAATPRLAGRRPSPAAAAAQPSRARSPLPSRPPSMPCSRVTHGWRSAYADCGSYGALDEVCDRLGLTRLRGAALLRRLRRRRTLRRADAAEPGTYVLTDFLAASFHRTRGGRARPGPLPRAARGLLRQLPTGGVAGPASDP